MAASTPSHTSPKPAETPGADAVTGCLPAPAPRSASRGPFASRCRIVNPSATSSTGSFMPVDRMTQVNPPSWPLPHLREDDDDWGQAAPSSPLPPYPPEPTWPAPSLLRGDDSESGEAESRSALPRYPPEPVWPESPHLRPSDPVKVRKTETARRAADATPPADPPQLRPGEVARWAAVASLRPAVTTLRPVATPVHPADPTPPPAAKTRRPAQRSPVPPASTDSRLASATPAVTAPRSAAATAWPDPTILRPAEPPQIRPASAAASPPRPAWPVSGVLPDARTGVTATAPLAVTTARLDRWPVFPHPQEPTPSSPPAGGASTATRAAAPLLDRLRAPIGRFRLSGERPRWACLRRPS